MEENWTLRGYPGHCYSATVLHITDVISTLSSKNISIIHTVLENGGREEAAVRRRRNSLPKDVHYLNVFQL